MARNRAPGNNRERLSSIPPTRVPRSAFDRSYSVKTTLDVANLYPVHIDEALPGDTYSFRPSVVARLATPLYPYYDGLYMDWQLFFVPSRLLWDNFTKMMGERVDPSDHNDYTMPQMVSDGYAEESLYDYMGLPTRGTGFSHTCLPMRAYYLIWNEWFRDANLQDSLAVPTDDGPDLPAEYTLQKRGKRKDYFTGALPFAQRGTAVSLPLGTTAPVESDGGPMQFSATSGPSLNTWQSLTSTGSQFSAAWTATGEGLTYEAGLQVDLENATAATINQIRQALAYQHLFERDARGGGRYREVILSHFGVQTDDIRLLRPEVVATGSFPINTYEIPVTAELTKSVGDIGAQAKAVGVGRQAMHSTTEHGYYMCLFSVRAELTYQDGLERMWSRKTRFDFYWPDLANIGEQAVLSREIYTDGTGSESAATGDFSVWGYQPRYEEYRVRYSRVTGEFRSNNSASLDAWHLALDFDTTRPTLDDTFIVEQPPINRITIDDLGADLLCDFHFKVMHVRPMPKFGTPGLVRF